MVFIIAECCINFRSEGEAALMIEQAAAAGADAAKFQFYSPEQVDYHPRKDELICRCLTTSRVKALAAACDECGIEFMATPMTLEAIKILSPYVHRWKIRYKDRHNKELSYALWYDKRQVLVSCDSITDSLFFNKIGSTVANEFVVAMACVPEYPPKEVVMPPVFAGRLVGFSSHYPDPAVPLMAAARGAKYIEVHVKLDRYDTPGEQFLQSGHPYTPIDDAVSLPMSDFVTLVNDIRQFEAHGG